MGHTIHRSGWCGPRRLGRAGAGRTGQDADRTVRPGNNCSLCPQDIEYKCPAQFLASSTKETPNKPKEEKTSQDAGTVRPEENRSFQIAKHWGQGYWKHWMNQTCIWPSVHLRLISIYHWMTAGFGSWLLDNVLIVFRLWYTFSMQGMERPEIFWQVQTPDVLTAGSGERGTERPGGAGWDADGSVHPVCNCYLFIPGHRRHLSWKTELIQSHVTPWNFTMSGLRPFDMRLKRCRLPVDGRLTSNVFMLVCTSFEQAPRVSTHNQEHAAGLVTSDNNGREIKLGIFKGVFIESLYISL